MTGSIRPTASALLVALAMMLCGAKATVQEAWESCAAPQFLTDAEAIAANAALRTANSWGPNWGGTTPLPGRTSATVMTTATGTLPTGLGAIKWALSNSRGIVGWDASGRIRTFFDRTYGGEWIQRDGSLTSDPTASIGATWVVGLGDPTSIAPTSTITISSVAPSSVTTFADGNGGDGLRVEHHTTGCSIVPDTCGLTLRLDYVLKTEFGWPTLRIYPSITGTHSGGKGLLSAEVFVPGISYFSGTQNVYVPTLDDGLEKRALGAGDAALTGTRNASGSWWGSWYGFMIDRRWGMYVAVEDRTGTLPLSFEFRPAASLAGFANPFTFRPQDGYGTAGNTIAPIDPIVLRPLCSEVGYAALAKQYRRFALPLAWSHPPVPLRLRSDAIARSDLMAPIGDGDSGTAGQVRTCNGTGAVLPSGCQACTGTNCNKLNGIDYIADEYGALPIEMPYYAATAPQYDATKNWGMGQPLIVPKMNSQQVVDGMLADYPSYAILPYDNPHTIDVSALYQSGARCGGSGLPGEGFDAGASGVASSNDLDPDLYAGLQKNPRHNVGGTCSRATPQFCGFAGYFGGAGAICNGDGAAGMSFAFASRMLTEIAETLSGTVGTAGLYLDTVPTSSAACFTAGCTVKGYTGYVYQSERTFLDQVAATLPAGPYGVASEFCSDYANAQRPECFNWTPVLYDAGDKNVQRVPLHSLVYHDWVQGTLMIPPGDDPIAAKIKLARALVFGQKPLLSAAAYQSDSIRGKVDGAFETTVKAFAKARRDLKNWLVDGELIAPIEVVAGSETTAALTTGWCNGQAYGATCTAPVGVGDALPVLQGAWWKGADGIYALIVANASQTSVASARIVPLPRFRVASILDCATAVGVNGDGTWSLQLNVGKVMVAKLRGIP